MAGTGWHALQPVVIALSTVMQGDHLQLLLQGLHQSGHLPSHGALMGISAGLFLPTTWLPDLGALSYVGALGVISALGLTGTLTVLTLQERPHTHSQQVLPM